MLIRRSICAPVMVPRHAITTMRENSMPPARPKSAQPKSSATVLLRAIAASKRKKCLNRDCETPISYVIYRIEDREVCDVCKEEQDLSRVSLTPGGWVRETDSYEPHGQVNCSWEVARWMPHLSSDVIGLGETLKRPETSIQSVGIRGCCRRRFAAGIWIRIRRATAKEAVD